MTSPYPPRPTQRWTVTRQVAAFVAVGMLAAALVGYATLIASQRIGAREGIVEARTKTLNKAQGLVQPAVTDALGRADPAAVARIAEVVERGVLDDDLVRVKIWTGEGLIVYSDEPRLQGARFTLEGEEQKLALDQGLIVAEVSDLSGPENRYERDQGKLLEVYLPILTPGGQRMLFEAYYRYDAVTANAASIWRSFAPISLGALAVLELVQIPLAYSLARRLRQRQREREGLLQQTLHASDVERRRIAADLHDGVVQELAGVAFSLAGAARGVPANHSEKLVLEQSAATLRVSITALRSLLVEIYPTNVAGAGLAPALADLLTRFRNDDLTTSLDATALDVTLSAPVAQLVYRATQEALRNVVSHAHASAVEVTILGSGRTALLEVTDNGVGYDHGSGPLEGHHFGLRGLTMLASEAGGQLTVGSRPGKGTTLRLELPLH